MPDTANFLRETFRELGAIKGERRHYMNIVQHEEPKGLSANEKAVRTKFWSDVKAQKLLRSIVRLQRSNPLFSVEDAREDLEEAEDLSLSKTKVNGLLSKFCTSNLIEKDRKDAEDWYCVSKINQNRLIHFMNADFGWYPDTAADDGLEYDCSDDDIDTSIEPESEPSLPADVTETVAICRIPKHACKTLPGQLIKHLPPNEATNQSIAVMSSLHQQALAQMIVSSSSVMLMMNVRRQRHLDQKSERPRRPPKVQRSNVLYRSPWT